MNKSMDFKEKIEHVERLLHKEEYTDSATRCVLVIEQALRQIVSQYLERVDEEVKLKVQELVQKKDRRGKGIEGLTMGNLVYVIRGSRFLEALAQVLEKDISSLQIIDFEKLTKLRNKFAHEAQEASHAEAELLLYCLKAMLEKFELKRKDSPLNIVKTILILSANPKDTARLRIDEEVREISEGLRRSKYRDRFIIHQKWAVRLKDLRRAMLDYEPQIVHFCGHGERNGLIW